MSVNEEIRDAAIRHAVMSERYGKGLARKIVKLLDEADVDMTDQLERRLARIANGTDNGPATTRRLTEVMAALETLNKAVYERERDPAGYAALIGANLPSNATVTITAGSFNGTVAAYSGFKDEDTTTKTIVQFSPVTTSTVTVQITSSSIIQIERLVVGKRVETEGIDQGCSQSFEDMSVIDTNNGHTTVEQHRVLTSWKAKMSWLSDSQWRQEFFSLFKKAGLSRAVLFVPTADDPSVFQNEAVFGRFSSVAKGDYNNHNNWVAEFTITALSD